MTSKSETRMNSIVRLARSPAIIPVLLLVEILETTFVPLPYEALFVALCLAAPKRIWLFLGITVIGSAIAGAIMYGLGAHLLDRVTDSLGLAEDLAGIEAQFVERGGTLIFLGGLTPVPSYLVNLTAGASGYPFLSFLGLFTLSRFIRFALLAALIHFFGDDLARLWKRIPQRLRWLLLVLFILLILWVIIGDLI